VLHHGDVIHDADGEVVYVQAVPAEVLVIRANDAPALERYLAGRVYKALFLYEPQGLEVYRVEERLGLINLSMIRAEAGDLAGALDAARQSLAIAAEIRTMQAVHSALEVCAGLAASRGDGPQAAAMFGAAEAFAARTGVKRDAADEAFLAPRIARARSALGAAAFEAAAREGGAMPLEGAADLARRWLETARPLLEA